MAGLGETLRSYLDAAFPAMWVRTSEVEEAHREISRMCVEEKWTCLAWDHIRGVYPAASMDAGGEPGVGSRDPINPVAGLPARAVVKDEKFQTVVLLLHNYHRYLQNPEVIQTLLNTALIGKQKRTFVVILSPVVILPPDIEGIFTVLEHGLPTRDQLNGVLEEVAEENVKIDDAKRPAILDAAAGMTRRQAESAFSLSIVRHLEVRPDVIIEVKEQNLKKRNLVTLHRGTETFDQVKGAKALKEFLVAATRPGRRVQGKGVVLLGPQGTGKSVIAKALGNEVGRPLLMADVGCLMGSLVGQSEANTRQLFEVAEAMAPSILFIDEVEKALSGVGTTNDGGVMNRIFGMILTWISDRAENVFLICTSNDISKLPPEFSRAERFDGVYFIDLPNAEAREEIWKQYRAMYDVPAPYEQPEDEGWTGAEIKACCRLSALMDSDLRHAAMNVVPVSKSAAEKLGALRDWADGRVLSADRHGIYHKNGAPMAGASNKGSVAPRRNLKKQGE